MQTYPSGPTYYACLQFEDAPSCVHWLESLPFERVAEAHEMVSAQVGLVARCELPGLERLRILEILYQTACHLQESLAKAYVGRALPLSIVEYSAWRTTFELWQGLFEAYRLVLESAHGGDAELGAHTPLLVLRTIEFTGKAIRDHHRVYREVPAALWRQLHAAYAASEELGLAGSGVSDPLAGAAPARTPASAYASILLAHLSHPYTMSPRQMEVMYRWARSWETLAGLGPAPVAPGVCPVLAVDFSQGRPPQPARYVEGGASVRYIVLEQLGQTLRRIIAALRQGKDPATLGLGDDCRQPGCERLLTLLYIQWCGTGVGHFDAGRDGGEDARACVGFDAVCRQLALGAVSVRAGVASIGRPHFTEHWRLVGSNAPGFLRVTRGPECDERIRHHQLVAIRRRSSGHFQLAVAQWLKLEESGELAIGLRLLPGIAQAVSVETFEQPGAESRNGNALLLPPVPEVRAPATLLLPPGLFRPGRELELSRGTVPRVRLLRLVELGVDFERAAFEALD